MWQVCTLPGHSDSVSRLQFSDDGVQAISGSDNDTVRDPDARQSQGCMVWW